MNVFPCRCNCVSIIMNVFPCRCNCVSIIMNGFPCRCNGVSIIMNVFPCRCNCVSVIRNGFPCRCNCVSIIMNGFPCRCNCVSVIRNGFPCRCNCVSIIRNVFPWRCNCVSIIRNVFPCRCNCVSIIWNVFPCRCNCVSIIKNILPWKLLQFCESEYYDYTSNPLGILKQWAPWRRCTAGSFSSVWKEEWKHAAWHSSLKGSKSEHAAQCIPSSPRCWKSRLQRHRCDASGNQTPSCQKKEVLPVNSITQWQKETGMLDLVRVTVRDTLWKQKYTSWVPGYWLYTVLVWEQKEEIN